MNEMNSDLSIPEFDQLDSQTYENLLRKMNTQQSTINLLHMQLKHGAGEAQNSQGSVDQSILDEKDRIIVSLQKELDKLKGSHFNSENGNPQALQEMEEENFQLEQNLRDKNRTIREMENRYNEHLNELNQKLQSLQQNQGESLQAKDSLDQKQLQEYQSEISELKQELEFTRNQAKNSSQHEEDKEILYAQISELKKDLEQKEGLLNQGQNDLDSLRRELQEENSRLRESMKAESTENGKELSLNQLNSLVGMFRKIEEHFQVGESNVSLEELKELKSACQGLLSQFDLEPFDCIGEKFDPNRHNLVATVYSSEHAHESIVLTNDPGFEFEGKVFCKANVTLSRNPGHCQSCNHRNEAAGKFCSQCGNRLEILDTSGTESEIPFLDDEANARSYLALGRSKLSKLQFEKAREAFEKSLSLHSKLQAARIGIAQCLESQGAFEPALEQLSQAVEDPAFLDEAKRIESRIHLKQRIAQDLQLLI